MAKAKKSETPIPETPKKPAAKAKAKAGVKAVVKTATAAPMVNTTLAAETAARMIGAKAGGGSGGFGAGGAGGPKKETSAFKQMKQSFTRPHAAGVGNMLNSTISTAAKKSNQPFDKGKQVGHNQTMGSEATRMSVPRRTGG